MPFKLFTAFIALLGVLLLSHCGYTLGGTTPQAMQGVSKIFIETPKNLTQHPQLEASLSNHLTDALIQDGQYKPTSFADADAKLSTEITGVDYRQIRSQRTDALRPLELQLSLEVEWKITSLDSTQKSLMHGSENGETRFYFEDKNLVVTRQNAFPDALSRLARQVVSSFSNGF